MPGRACGNWLKSPARRVFDYSGETLSWSCPEAIDARPGDIFAEDISMMDFLDYGERQGPRFDIALTENLRASALKGG
jgi:hypothetical protein